VPYLIDDNNPVFPHPLLADDDGLLAVGGKITPEFLMAAYKWGIFPWFDPSIHPVLWWFPKIRPVFFPGQVKVSKSMRRWFRRHSYYKITVNKAFDEVVYHCAEQPGRKERGSWLTPELQEAVKHLFRLGFAHSVEVWNQEDKLVGGLYGIVPGNGIFSGESMFHLEPDTSKAALIYLVRNARNLGFKLIDGQVESAHLMSLGARLIPALEFLRLIRGGRVGL